MIKILPKFLINKYWQTAQTGPAGHTIRLMKWSKEDWMKENNYVEEKYEPKKK